MTQRRDQPTPKLGVRAMVLPPAPDSRGWLATLQHRERNLRLLAEAFVNGIEQRSGLGATLGKVRTVGPPPYWRIDCDRRALTYVRARPKHDAVRLDLAPAWIVPTSSRLAHPKSHGGRVLLLRDTRDMEDAIELFEQIVIATRRAEKTLL